MLVYLLAAFAGAALTYIVLRAQQRGATSAPASTPAPTPPPAPPTPAAESGPVSDPFLSRLYLVRSRMLNDAPRPSMPDELMQMRPFAELVALFSDPEVPIAALLRYAEGDDAMLAWASLTALAARPHDPEIEARLMSDLNRFHAWSRHFILRVLETWRPDDRWLAGVVLGRVDSTWESVEPAQVLEEFLRRRAKIAPLTMEGAPLLSRYKPSTLRSVLLELDPDLVGGLLEELGPEPPSPMPGSDRPGVSSTLEDLGRVWKDGSLKADGLVPHPSTDEQVERVVTSLTLAPARPTLVVGAHGAGKTTLIRRVCARLSSAGWTVFEASASQINAGMTFVGMLEARVHSLRAQLTRGKVVWVVPEFQQLLWAGRASNNPVGVLELILPWIESGEVMIVGEVRPAALERLLIERPEIGRLFEIVRIEPMSPSESAALIDGWSDLVAKQRSIEVPNAIRTEALSLARQYLSSEASPGGVLRLLDRAVLIASRRSTTSPVVTIDDLVDALVQLTGLPADVLDDRRPLELATVRARFESRVMGQPEAVDCLIERLALIKAGVTDPRRPYGVFLFAGGTGTGKTELARSLAEYLFGSPDRLVRIDMSELQDGRTDRLLGSGNSATGGNSLAELVRRQPFCVVLLDEFEKAHGQVWDLFLQVFDDGRLTDHRGETVDLRHAIIILTSNLGTGATGARLGMVGDADQFSPTTVERAIQRTFRPELFNRLDRVVVFRPLTREIMRRILRKELADTFERRGLRRRDWAVELEDSALDLLVDRGFSPALGARPLKRALESLLLTPLARAIVDRSTPAGDQFLFVRADGDRLEVEFVDPDAPDLAGPFARPPAGEAPADIGQIVYEPRGSHDEVERLGTALASVRATTATDAWSEAKRRLFLDAASPGFWERADRFDTLGRTEYLDRIESSLRSASSLFERLRGTDGHAPRSAYPRELVQRLAQQLLLLEAASAEALEHGPRDAFLSLTVVADDAAPGESEEFAQRLAKMYEAWARRRGMRWASLGGRADAGGASFAVSGFAAFALVRADDGLHVRERDTPRGVRRDTVRVRVAPQPSSPARDVADLRRQADAAFASPAGTPAVVRRYREEPSPLVRDGVRGWRTGRIDRVLAGEFDVIPAGEK